MAKRRTYTLNAELLADIKEVVRRVIRDGGGSIAITPYNRGSPPQRKNKPAQIGTTVASGFYQITLYSGGTTVSSGSGLSMPMGMTAGTVALMANPEESGLPTHWVKQGSFTEVDPTPIKTTEDGTPVYMASGPMVYRTDSPQTVYGSGLTASTATWNRNAATSGTDYGNCPVTMYRERIERDDSNSKLVKFYWYETFDAGGRFLSATAETAADLLTSC